MTNRAAIVPILQSLKISTRTVCVLVCSAAVQWGNADREIMCIRIHCSVT